MAIVINGSGTVTGLAVGGLPDGTVDDGTVASGIASSKLTGALPAISGASLTGFTDAQMPTGSVLQVVQGTTSTKASTTSAGYADTGLTATITPSSSSNKILVIISTSCYNSADATGYLRLLRNVNSNLKDYGYPSMYNGVVGLDYVPIHYLDSPSSTSANTYKLQHKRTGGTSAFHSNYGDGGGTMPSFITLLEIAG